MISSIQQLFDATPGTPLFDFHCGRIPDFLLDSIAVIPCPAQLVATLIEGPGNRPFSQVCNKIVYLIQQDDSALLAGCVSDYKGFLFGMKF